MSRFLKQSTAFIFRIGPFVDSVDGVTPETALTIAQADIQISKNGGAFAQTSAVTPTTTHDTDGWYQCPLTATDTGTLGPLTVQINMTGALPVWEHFTVVAANVYDSLVAGTDTLQADVTQIGGVAQSATDLKDFADAGYDPATNKVQGVVLVDATTANTDMRGTDSAALASVCTEARLAELAAANLPTDVDSLLARLSATRAGYLDKLNITGNVAASAEVLAIQNNTRTTIAVPGVMERPDAGSTRFKIYLNNYDTAGNMEAPDSAPTVAVVNEEGVDRSLNLQHPTTHVAQTTMVLVDAGRYWIEYDLDNADAMEGLIFTFSVVEGAVTRKFDRVAIVVDTTAVDFTAADRAKLDTLHDTRITAVRATGLDNLDAPVSTRSTVTTAQVRTEADAALVANQAAPLGERVIGSSSDRFTAGQDDERRQLPDVRAGHRLARGAARQG